jgi:hypothetical protein
MQEEWTLVDLLYLTFGLNKMEAMMLPSYDCGVAFSSWLKGPYAWYLHFCIVELQMGQNLHDPVLVYDGTPH